MIPVDHTQRAHAVDALDTSMVVVAGAGSGKTTVLSQRLLERLLAWDPTQHDLPRVAAVTFTEKATTELLERIRDGLEAHLAAHPDDATAQLLLARFGELQVSTLHSFCQALLTQEALVAGWAPDTTLNDGSALAAARSPALRRWLGQVQASSAQVATLIRQQVTMPQLVEALGQALEYRDLRPHLSGPPWSPEDLHAELVVLHEDIERFAEGCIDDSCPALVKNADLRDMLSVVANMTPFAAVGYALSASPSRYRRAGAKKRWAAHAQDFLATVKATDAWEERARSSLHRFVAEALAEQLVPEVLAARRALAVADYADLLHRARELLREQPAARARLASRYDALLIDEVQDTDPLQAEVAGLLAQTVADGWNQAPPRPGAIFLVGDPKQSIYRFRRADEATWHQLAAWVGPAGRVELQQNFRSVPGLVSWFNHVFGDMPDYVSQVAARGPASLEPVVALPGSHDGEPARIARYLAELAEQGAEVVDRDTGALRPLTWSDVMVLVPAWTRAAALREALEVEGIPALVEGGRAFFTQPAVELLTEALRCLDDPGDGEALVEVLREVFGFTLAELHAHKQAGGALRYTVPGQPPSAVSRAQAVLSRLHRARGRRSWVELLRDLLAESRLLAVWALLPDGDARLAALDQLEAVLHELEAEARSPSEVVLALAERARAADEKETSRAEEGFAMVRITTLFSAKGLEAPVVVVAENRRSRRGVSVAWDREEGTYAHKVGKLAPVDWKERASQEKAREEAERRRWTYVACTRPRDQLVLPVTTSDEGKAPSSTDLTHAWLAAGITGVLQAEDGDVLDLTEDVRVAVRWVELTEEDAPAPLGPLTPAVDAALQGSGAVDETEPAWQAARVEAVRQCRLASQRRRSVTELAYRGRVRHTPGTGVGKVGGQVLHAVLERLDFGAAAPAQAARAHALLPALARARGLTELEPLQEALDRILANPHLDEARQAPEHWREVPFSHVVRGTQVRGVIDLCYPLDPSRSHWRVVDFKSDAPPEGSPARERYDRQLAQYARALLATLTPCTQVSTALVGPHAALGVADPAELAIDEVREELTEALRAALQAGAAVPEVGVSLPTGVPAELSWESAKVALVLLPMEPGEAGQLEDQGWTLGAFDRDDVGWVDAAIAWLEEVRSSLL